MPTEDPFAISAEDVEGLGPEQLRLLLNNLLYDEARASGAAILPRTAANNSSSDGGIDAMLQSFPIPTLGFFPSGDSVWQFRAATNFPSTAKVKDEILQTSHAPLRLAIEAGSNYVFVTNSQPARPDTLATRQREIDDVIKELNSGCSAVILSSEDLARWCTSLPWTRYVFRKFFPNTVVLSREANLPEHAGAFAIDPLRTETIDSLREAIADPQGPIHIHVEGLAGVGKTRLLIEAFGDRLGRILYCLEQPSVDLMGFFEARESARGVLIVDDCNNLDDANRIGHLAKFCGGRLKVITIGHDRAGRPSGHVLHLDPLSSEATIDMIQSLSVRLPHEQASFIAQISQGYVRLARLLAEEVLKSGTRLTAATLADGDGVGAMLKRLIPDPDDRRAAQVVALFKRAGWEEDVEFEGKAVAEALGLNWPDVKSRVEAMRTNRVVQAAGRFRYVTPELLAVWLAAEAWRVYPAELSGLLAELPDSSRRRLLDRIRSLSGIKEVEAVTRSFLAKDGPFGSLAAIDSDSAAVIGGLAEAAPLAAARLLSGVIERATPEELLQFGDARMRVVWTLESLAWRSETFEAAAKALCRLALHENESWENNAKGTWSKLFLVKLGATEVPWMSRLSSLANCVKSDDPRAWNLAVSAIDQALTAMEIGQGYSTSDSGELPRPRWHPKTWGDDWECRRTALSFVDELLDKGDAALRSVLLTTLSERTDGLIRLGLADEILTRLEKVHDIDADTRRKMWENLVNCLALLEEEPELRRRLEAVRIALAGESLRDRALHTLGKVSYFGWDGDRKFDRPGIEARRLADEFFEEPTSLDELWDWLGSRKAENVGPFARRLGELDVTWSLGAKVVVASIQGGSSALLGEYLAARAAAGDDETVATVLRTLYETEEWRGAVVESTLRLPPSQAGVELLLTAARQRAAPPESFWMLWSYEWRRFLKPRDMREVLEFLLSTGSAGAAETALTILDDSLDQNAELPRPLLALAWKLAEHPPDVGHGGMASYYWERILRYLTTKSPARAAKAVVAAIEAGMDRREGRGLLRELLRDNPDVVWPILAKRLAANRVLVWRLGMLMDEPGPLDTVDPTIIFDWIDERDVEQRARIVAQLVKPLPQLSALVRGLLMRFGAESGVAGALYGNFSSGGWSGEQSAREKRQLQIVRGWFADPEPEVVKWAQKIADDLETQIPRLEREEAERDL